MWQPIETAPMDQFLLLCGPSGYTTTPMVVTTGRMCSDYHAGRWIDHANDDLTDWGFEPTHWAPLDLPGAQPAPSVPEGWKLVPIEPTPGMMRGAHRLVAAARRVLASADSQGLIRLDESGDVASELRSALEAAPEAKP